MSRIVAVACALALAATVALGASIALGSEAATGSPPTELAGVPLLLTSTAGGLAWTGGPDDDPAVAFRLGSDADFAWDLTEIDSDGYRSDLVTVTIDDVRGPGRLVVEGVSPFGVRESLIDSTAGARSTYLQVGREGTFRWTFDRPGVYEVDVTATVPTTGGGIDRTSATYRLEATSTAASPVGPPTTVLPGADDASSTRDIATVESFASAASADPGRDVPAGQRVVIDDGHVDMGPRIVDGAWRVQLKDDSASPIVWRDLADVVLHARDASRLVVPSGEAFAFLGAPGSTVYVLPQVQQSGLVWPGWNSQDPSVLDAVPGSVTWRLTGVDGPGRFVLYVAGSFGDTDILFDTANALPQHLPIARNTHVHGNWAFTESGVYRLSVEMTATSASGADLSDTRILTIAVGDGTDPGSAFTPDPEGSGTPVVTAPDSLDGSGSGGDSMAISVDAGTSGSGGRGAGAGLPSTGLGGLASTLAVAAVLVGIGSALTLWGRRRRTMNRIESHS